MSKEAQITVRVKGRLRNDAEKILRRLGVSTNEAVNIFLSQVALQKGFPFAVKIPNRKTINAFRQTELNKDKLKTYHSAKELFTEMDKW